MAKRSVIVIGIAVVIVAISMAYGAIANPGGDEEKRQNSEVWNIRISGPEFYDVPTIGDDIGVLGVGTYEIGFVPMGDSPEILNIIIMDKDGNQVFDEEFFLEKSLVDTGISKYYTWEYIGEKFVTIPERDKYEIVIYREGNLKGSVSIGIEKLDRSI